MTDLGRILVYTGIFLAVAGIGIMLAARFGFRGLPGDIVYQTDHVRVYVPIVSCIVISLLFTLGAWLWRWWRG
ncbi:MAG: DUF2905 domain-containing protein [Tepidisphaeraceae bacterium]